jgi:hypothetical protein
MGSFTGKFESPETVEIPFEFDQSTRNRLTIQELDAAGSKAAVRPMEMELPVGLAPAPDALPGTTIGTERVDDADLVTKFVEGDRFAGAGRSYLYVSARTPYNDLLLPMMGLDATVTRDGETVFEGTLERAIDPTLNYHYGAAVEGLQSGDEVALSVVAPPQVGRHEGYERAFLQMGDVSFTV